MLLYIKVNYCTFRSAVNNTIISYCDRFKNSSNLFKINLVDKITRAYCADWFLHFAVENIIILERKHCGHINQH